MGKFGMKIDSNWRGETAASDRKCEVDVSYEYQGAGSLNMFNIRVITDSSPLVNIKDNIICLRADSNFQAAPADIVDISVYDKPPSAKANVEFVMGNPSPSSRNQVSLAFVCRWLDNSPISQVQSAPIDEPINENYNSISIAN